VKHSNPEIHDLLNVRMENRGVGKTAAVRSIADDMNLSHRYIWQLLAGYRPLVSSNLRLVQLLLRLERTGQIKAGDIKTLSA